MSARLHTGTVHHHRLTPVSHRFEYPVYFYEFDIADLAKLDRNLPGFGYNRLRPVAIHDRDYLDPGPGPLAEKLHARLADAGFRTPPARMVLITGARCWNYVFNPVNFYLGFATDGRMCCAVAEVNNTFGDRHLYVIPDLQPGPAPGEWVATLEKAFHVSPFNDMQGRYLFSFRCADGEVDIRVDMQKEGRTVFLSRLMGRGVPLTTRSLWANLMRRPFTAALTIPRITFQAMQLRFRRKLPVRPRPEPTHPMTIVRRPPGLFARWARALVLSQLARIRQGELIVTLPDGDTRRFGTHGAKPAARFTVHRHDVFTRIVRGGDVGFGEAFTAGDWSSEDPARVLELIIANRTALADGNWAPALAARLANRVAHLLRDNTRRQGRRNILAHYDLGNAFYERFLDPTMTYSCALFDTDASSLEAAQLRKVHRLIERARIHADHHLLEIGCGWGTFAIEAARRSGCRVTGITVSDAQYRLATERVRTAGLADRVDIRLCDYRDLRGTFDRIVSVEMLEAVGHRHLPAFFASCNRLLAPHGLIVAQVITIPDERYARYRRDCDWIQKHIFPGGHLPSLGALNHAMVRAGFHVEALENIGPHYATTLRLWRERFDSEADHVRALGFDDAFIRTWRYYLAYCEAAFATRSLNTLQLVLTRTNNAELDGPPQVRSPRGRMHATAPSAAIAVSLDAIPLPSGERAG